MKTTAILFDFDGTVMDTEPAILASYRHIFGLYRTEEDFTEERQVEVLGPSLDSEMRKFFPEKDPEECITEYRHYQNQHIQQLVKPFPGAQRLLEYCHAQGYPTGIVSTRLKDSLEHILSFSHMESWFDVIIGQDEVVNGKPDPEGIRKAMELCGCTDSIYVGDSYTDILAGKAAGSYTVAFASKEEKKEALLATQPDEWIANLDELREILEKRTQETN